jgi:predicted ATP-binding protein involved in virulence
MVNQHITVFAKLFETPQVNCQISLHVHFIWKITVLHGLPVFPAAKISKHSPQPQNTVQKQNNVKGIQLASLDIQNFSLGDVNLSTLSCESLILSYTHSLGFRY